MKELRQSPPVQIWATPVAFADDYSTGQGTISSRDEAYPLPLGRANVLHYRFADGGFVMVRPSGTEPKLKLYFSVVGQDRAEAEQRLAAVRSDMLKVMGLAK